MGHTVCWLAKMSQGPHWPQLGPRLGLRSPEAGSFTVQGETEAVPPRVAPVAGVWGAGLLGGCQACWRWMSWEEEEGPGARSPATQHIPPRLEHSHPAWASRNGDQRPVPGSGHMAQERRITPRSPVTHLPSQRVRGRVWQLVPVIPVGSR